LIKIIKESTDITIKEEFVPLLLNAINYYKKTKDGQKKYSEEEFDIIYSIIEREL
jgi:hypothetical protein